MSTSNEGLFSKSNKRKKESYFDQIKKYNPTGERYLVIKSLDNNNAGLNSLSVFQKTKGLSAITLQADIIAKLKDGSLLVLTKTKAAAENIINSKVLAGVAIIAREHESLNFTKGIIFCNDLINLSNEDLLDEFKLQHVVEIYRIQKRSQLQKDTFEPTSGLILTFNLPSLPEIIKAGYLNIQVRQYIPNPLRCRKCQVFGHSKNSCQNVQTCDICTLTEEHPLPCVNEKKCVNCGGSHPSFDRKCNVYIKEAEIMYIKTMEKVSYFEAKRRYNANLKDEMSFAQAVANNLSAPLPNAEIEALKKSIEEINKQNNERHAQLIKKLDDLTIENKNLNEANAKLLIRVENQSKTISNLKQNADNKKSQKNPPKPAKIQPEATNSNRTPITFSGSNLIRSNSVGRKISRSSSNKINEQENLNENSAMLVDPNDNSIDSTSYSLTSNNILNKAAPFNFTLPIANNSNNHGLDSKPGDQGTSFSSL